MELITQNIFTALNKTFLVKCPIWAEINVFKEHYDALYNSINENDSEETSKAHINDFLKNIYYKEKYTTKVNVNNIDLVIFNDNKADSKIGVILETKALKSNEIITLNDLNKKSFYEIIQYYLEERIMNQNIQIKHLIITNSRDWYIFDASEFERIFVKTEHAPSLQKIYIDWYNGKLVNKNKDWFYTEIAKPFVANSTESIICTYFQINKNFDTLINTGEEKIIELYKIFSPEHLLKLPFQNDSNTLNTEFYNELLHIMGLYETNDNVRRIVRLKKPDRHEGSLLENIISIIEADDILPKIKHLQGFEDFLDLETDEEQVFSIALELCITWINRILFIKLFESQLLKYNNNNSEFSFLNSSVIKDFEDLRELFFDVLAILPENRKTSLQRKYEYIPYLNSSLFELTFLEKEVVKINHLKEHVTLAIYDSSVLKDANGRKKSGKMPVLPYIFEFLDSYNFASDKKLEIQETDKTIINSAVLGLIFEKINGYKEGSFFTPGYITMYICRETIRNAVIQKFRGFPLFEKVENFTDLYNKIGQITLKQANDIINSIKICDPAVGSGHFLVSALNELITIKSELGILMDKDGKLLRNTYCSVQNDEIFISHFTLPFTYNFNDPESQRIQETIFNEKRTLIENCLFGVDINPKSVQICQLRLWIELLKNAYYIIPTAETSRALLMQKRYFDMETLPNIDINIKCGNSLVSRFALNGNGKNSSISQTLTQTAKDLKEQVAYYKKVLNKKDKQLNVQKIKELKSKFENLVNPLDKDYIELKKKRGERTQTFIAYSKDEMIQWEMKMKRLDKEIEELDRKYNEKLRALYSKSIEWRFEFPEVLDENGYFAGFDAVVGNPPYIRQEQIKVFKPYFQTQYQVYNGTADLLTYFVELAYNILNKNGHFGFIVSNKFAKANYGKELRKFLLSNVSINNYVDLSEISVFDSASVDTAIITYSKLKIENNSFTYHKVDKTIFQEKNINTLNFNTLYTNQNELDEGGWNFMSNNLQLIKQKIEQQGKLLKDWELNINFGIKTGLNEVFIIDEKIKNELIEKDAKSIELLKPLLRGRDIKKYTFEYQNLWLIAIFPSKKIDIKKYSAILNYLKKFEKELQQNGEINSRKKTSNKWFETQDNVAYWKTFSENKIIYPEFSSSNSFVWDSNSYYPLDTTWMIYGKQCTKYLLALLNSKLIWFYLKNTVSVLGTQAFRMKKFYLENLPLIQLPITKQKSLEILVDKILLQKHEKPNADTSLIEQQIDNEVYKLYNLTVEEIKLIENDSTTTV